MKLYITTGTMEYLKNLLMKYDDDTIFLLQNASNGILIHETNSLTFFQSPHQYEVIESLGELQEGTVAVFDYAPVSNEGKPLFEYYGKNLVHFLSTSSPVKAIRVLRPYSALNLYCIITVWQNKADFEHAKLTGTYPTLTNKAVVGIDRPTNIFVSKPYQKVFLIV